MRVVIAPDSFKECLFSPEVALALRTGVLTALPDAEVVLKPMADGGEGTVDAMLSAVPGERVCVQVSGPLGHPVRASYALIDGGNTAVIEMASAAGLGLVPEKLRNPLLTTTFGVGELIRDVLDRGVSRVIVGLGGSATNDGGAGMARALGYALLDAEGAALPQGGGALHLLDRIDGAKAHPGLGRVEVIAASDVRNPLCGANGASRVYGPQKGATPQMVEVLDNALGHFAAVVQRDLGIAVANVPGAGAAGGLGAGLTAFAQARIEPGFELVAKICGLAQAIAGADLVITGEGSLDGQTVHGKTPIGVARIARQAGVPVIAIAGRLRPGYEAVLDAGIDAAYAIAPDTMDTATAIRRARELLADTSARAVREWMARRGPL